MFKKIINSIWIFLVAIGEARAEMAKNKYSRGY